MAEDKKRPGEHLGPEVGQNGGGRIPIKNKFIQFAETEEEKANAKYDMDVFHEVFLEHEDFTEYRPALALVGSWELWCKWKREWPMFRNNIEMWKQELEIKLRSRAMQKLTALVDSKSEQTAANVCKFLVQCGWDKREGAGRPSKEEMRRQAQDIARAAADTQEEETRVLELITGGKNG
jgi:hypothetical protein